MRRIDNTDAKILNLLQNRGRMKRNTLSEHVGLSVPSISERMRKLEEHGVILGYHGVVDAKKLQFDITAFIRVSVETSHKYEPVIEQLCACDEILEVHSITGEGSHVLKVRTQNTTSLEELLSRIQAWPGVTGTRTSIVLSTFKETRQVVASPIRAMESTRR